MSGGTELFVACLCNRCYLMAYVGYIPNVSVRIPSVYIVQYVRMLCAGRWARRAWHRTCACCAPWASVARRRRPARDRCAPTTRSRSPSPPPTCCCSSYMHTRPVYHMLMFIHFIDSPMKQFKSSFADCFIFNWLTSISILYLSCLPCECARLQFLHFDLIVHKETDTS